jgi:hypothetical protein
VTDTGQFTPTAYLTQNGTELYQEVATDVALEAHSGQTSMYAVIQALHPFNSEVNLETKAALLSGQGTQKCWETNLKEKPYSEHILKGFEKRRSP